MDVHLFSENPWAGISVFSKKHSTDEYQPEQQTLVLTIKRIKLISLNSRMQFAEKVRPIVKKKIDYYSNKNTTFYQIISL